MAKRPQIDDVSVPKTQKALPPAYRIYPESKVAISKSVGKAWEQRYRAAMNTYNEMYEVWQQIFAYYNFHHMKALNTPRGVFKRGDSSENILFSNLNVLLPAVYSKNPEITCNTTDVGDEDFCKAIEGLLNVLLQDEQGLNAKARFKKAAGMALLTNFGVIKLEYTQKDDSREVAAQEMADISQDLETAKGIKEVEKLYGRLEALESQMEVLEPSGPRLLNVMPHNLIVDPNAEMQDGSDANWMIERCFLPTEYLNARFTQADPDFDDDRVLVYKPTHKANLTTGDGRGDTALGLVMDAVSGVDANMPTSFTSDERNAYVYTYMTECYYVWDKATRRVMLFQRDDWSWPLWVWDDPDHTRRFFPYYFISYTFSTGGAVTVGETAFYLDQQDEINDINRQVARIRRSVFDFFVFNSDKVKMDDVEPLIDIIRGKTEAGKHVIGIRAGDQKISDVLEALAPPALDFEKLFNKDSIIATINRTGNVSDALRGVQFKTNTNEAAVNSYNDAVRLSVGAKTDVIEDTVALMAYSLAEMCLQYMDQQTVEGLIGPSLAKGWRSMSLTEFRSTYTLDIVAGSMEKQNSVYKKKEAVQIAQAVGQFAQAAPGAITKIMLKVLEKAFSEVVIEPGDWDMIDQEVTANLQKGVSTQGAGPTTGPAQPPAPGGAPQPGGPPPAQRPGQPGPAPGGGGNPTEQLLANAPPQLKMMAARAAQAGAPKQQIIQMLTHGAQGNG